MIVPDTNLLIYAHNEQDPDHAAARRWWETLLGGGELIGIPWVVSTGYIRITTLRGALDPPVDVARAVDGVARWFELPHVVTIDPGPDHLTHFRRNLVATGVGGNLVTDAHIAALAMEHQAEVHSHDSDFGRFPGLRWHDPIRNPR